MDEVNQKCVAYRARQDDNQREVLHDARLIVVDFVDDKTMKVMKQTQTFFRDKV